MPNKSQNHPQFNASIIAFTVAALLGNASYAQTAPQILPVGEPVRLAVPATTVADPQAVKLTYRPGGTALTVNELSDVQRKTMEEDFFKRAGYTDKQPQVVKTTGSGGAFSKSVAPVRMNTLVVVGVYGPASAQRADVSFNGELKTAAALTRFGNITIESIEPSRLEVSYNKKTSVSSKAPKGKGQKASTSVRQTLKPGDVLEIPA